MSSGRRTGQLHLNRVSGSEAVYFVTCCTYRRGRSLLCESLATTILSSIKESDGDHDTLTFGFTIMPDHCHWVFRQGSRLSLGRIVAKFKSATREALAGHGLEWQRDFYEHRLPLKEDPEDYALYTFLNPYRAGLIANTEIWPVWWSAEPAALRFITHLDEKGCPPGEWLHLPVPSGVRPGE